jgi:NAD-dependent dihydropyrimidine dehydrogenase PreA subunit
MRLIRSVLFACVLASPGIAAAGVSLNCSNPNLCFASISSPGSPTPFNIYWGWNYSPGAPHVQVIVPSNCEDDDSCIFRCPNGDSQLDVTVTVTDANNTFIGSDTDSMFCWALDG